MEHHIHLAIQVVPLTHRENAYPIIDTCIEEIEKSGCTYQVSAMETSIEGPYPELMKLVTRIRDIAHSSCDEILINIKMHSRKSGSVRFEEKGL